MTFGARDGRSITEVAVRINQRTAMIGTGTAHGGTWRLPFHMRDGAHSAGIQVGYPMLNDALVDFSIKQPQSYKLRGFKLRWFFKEALRDFLPAAIITKQKKGFGLPFGVWATQHPALKALAGDSVRSFATRGVVRPEFVRQLLDELLPAHPGYYGEMVWILMMLEQWLRAYAPDWRFDRGHEQHAGR